MPEWPFADPPNVAVITVAQVMRQGSPVLLVCHDADDGGWQFLTGGSFDVADGMIVSLEAMLKHDPTLVSLSDLPIGWCARRTRIGAEWSRAPQEPESDDWLESRGQMAE